jgi:zinc protease
MIQSSFKCGSVPVWIDQGPAFPIVDLIISVGAGSAHDPEGLEGVAMLVARMLRRGIQGMDGDAFESRLASMGAMLGSAPGAYSTTIHVRCLARSIDNVMALVVNMLALPKFDDVAFGVLLGEARSELLQGCDNIEYISDRALQREMFRGHPAGRSTSGTFASLAKVTTKDLREFYEKWYTSKNMAVAVTGPCGTEKVKTFVESLTHRLSPAHPDAFAWHVIQWCHDTPKIVVVHKANRQQVRMMLGARIDLSTVNKYAATSIINAAVGEIGTSMLRRAIREDGRMSYIADSSLSIDRAGGQITVTAEPDTNALADCVIAVLGIMEQVRDENIDPDLLELARTYLVNGYPFEVETANDRVCRRLSEYRLGVHAGFLDDSTTLVSGMSRDELLRLGTSSFSGTKTPCIVLVGDVERIDDALQTASLFQSLDWERVDVSPNDIDA